MPLDRLSNSVYARIYRDPYLASESNKGYIDSDEYIIVVDATHLLSNLRNDLLELRKITDHEVRFVVNTHYHYDHTFGDCLFGCDIIAHSQCVQLMKREKSRQLSRALQEVTDPKDRDTLKSIRYPNVVFEESYQLDSSPRVEVIHLGGHTPDLSVVHVPEEGILFASDDLFGSSNPSTPIFPEMNSMSDLAIWESALQRILNMDARIIVPGHVGVCNGKAVSKLIENLELFITTVRDLKGRGYSKEEVKRRPEILRLPKVYAEELQIIENNIETQYDRI